MTLDQLTPLVRHILQIGAGALVARGYINEEIALGLTGLGMSALSFAWYKYSKSRAALIGAE